MSVNLFMRGLMIIFSIIGLFFNWNGNWILEVALGLYMLEHFFALFSPHSFNKVVLICAAIPIIAFWISSNNWGIADIVALIVSVVTIVHTLISIKKFNRDPAKEISKILSGK